MKSLRKRINSLEQSHRYSEDIKETALAIFKKDGSVNVEWNGQTFKLKDENKYQEFLDENELHGSPTNIVVIEVRSIGEMPEVS